MSEIADDRPLSLKEAAKAFGLTVSALRTEAGRERLTIYKIGNKHFTTLADMKEMLRQCRVERKGRDFTLIRGESSGLSETDRVSSAQERAKASVAWLKSISRSTSATNTGPSRQASR